MSASEWLARRLETAARRLRGPVIRGTQMGGWDEQWKRVLLGLDRVRAIYQGRPEREGTAGAFYDVLGFFLNCHHLRDWISADETLTRGTRRKAKQLWKSDAALAACADLANRSKHSSLTTAHTGDREMGPSGNDVTITPGVKASHQFRISVDDVEQDALLLAEQCVIAWTAFLRRRQLI